MTISTTTDNLISVEEICEDALDVIDGIYLGERFCVALLSEGWIYLIGDKQTCYARDLIERLFSNPYTYHDKAEEAMESAIADIDFAVWSA